MRRTLSVLFAISMFVPAIAGAQTTDPTMPTAEATAAPPASADPLAPENWPLSAVDRPLGLSAGMLQVDLKTLASLNKGAAGKPFSIPLGVLYGVTNEIQLALLHSTGLCISGKSNNCAKVYNDLQLQVLFSLFGRGSSLEIATFGQLNFTQLSDPLRANIQVGGAANWVTGGGNIAVLAYPSVGIGVTERDTGNKEYISAPIYAYFRAAEKLAPYLFTGLNASPLDGFGDFWSIPAGVGALYSINHKFDVGAEFDLTNPFNAPEGAGAADGRALYVWLSVRPL